MDKVFLQIRQTLLERAREADIDENIYARILTAGRWEDIIDIIQRDVFDLVRTHVIDSDLIWRHKTQFAKENIFCEDSGDGIIVATGGSLVRAYNSADVFITDFARVYARNFANVYAFGDSCVNARDKVTVYAYDNVKGRMSHNVCAELYDNADIRRYSPLD